MLDIEKKKITAILLALLIVISSIAVIVNIDKLEGLFTDPEPIKQEIVPEETSELDPNTKLVGKLIEQLDEEMMRGYIEKITSFGPHPTLRRILNKICPFDLPIQKVAKYIFNELSSMGLSVRYQDWEEDFTLENFGIPEYFPGWYEGRNIEATLPGKNKDSDEIYVIVAHYDTWPFPRSPGADDDSSGVAAILSAAKIMNQFEFNDTIKFLLVDGEEVGLLGAEAYVKEAVANGDNIVGTICIDMIGSKSSSFRDTEVLIVRDEQSQWITDYSIKVNEKYSDQLGFSIFQDGLKGNPSDYLKFLEHGMDAIFYGESEFNDYWHTRQDTIENMDMDKATKTAQLIMATIAELALDVEHDI